MLVEGYAQVDVLAEMHKAFGNNLSAGNGKLPYIINSPLIKDNWVITHDQFRVEYEKLEIFADLAVEKSHTMIAKKNGKKIIIEIKTFAGRSFIKELQLGLIMSYTWLSANLFITSAMSGSSALKVQVP